MSGFLLEADIILKHVANGKKYLYHTNAKDWQGLCSFWGGTACKAQVVPWEIPEVTLTCSLQGFSQVVCCEQEVHIDYGFQLQRVQNENESRIFETFGFDICLKKLVKCQLPWIARNQGFPTSTGGKGADTAILSSWLEHAMEEMAT